MSDDTYTITIGGTEETNDTGGEWLSNISYDVSSTADTITLDGAYTFQNESYIDPARVKQMSEHYPALKKAWDNFYSIYKMVDQDFKGNHEKEEEIPF
tara:strand:+ start:225 stop:518 length:294 start_codon:yes stop_codon:yes gene_type:complete